MKKLTKGKIIVLDGKDGSGKATQTTLLAERISSEGFDVETLDFPRYDSNVLGGLIRECLDGKLGDFLALDPKITSVLYAADRFESKTKIEKWLSEGKIVVLDRYVSANQVHQGGKITDDYDRKDFLAWLDNLEFGVFGLPRPDSIVFLDVPVEVSMKLASERALQKGISADTAESDLKHQMGAQESALSIIKSSNSWIRIDCGDGKGGLRTRENIAEDIFDAIKNLLQ